MIKKSSKKPSWPYILYKDALLRHGVSWIAFTVVMSIPLFDEYREEDSLNDDILLLSIFFVIGIYNIFNCIKRANRINRLFHIGKKIPQLY